jgi:hypothetical protein
MYFESNDLTFKLMITNSIAIIIIRLKSQNKKVLTEITIIYDILVLFKKYL